MPLGGPRPNPKPVRPIADLSVPRQSHIDSTSSLNGPAISSDSPSSSLPYPHQSSPESGTTVLEPLNEHDDVDLTAQNIRDDWTRNNGYTAPPDYPNEQSEELEEDDIGNGGYALSTPNPYADFDRDRSLRAPSPSLGPWDSASQRYSANQSSNRVSISNPHPQSVIPLKDSLATAPVSRNHLRQKPSVAGLSYIDEEGLYYKSDNPRPASLMARSTHDLEMRGLVGSAAGMGTRQAGIEEEEPFRIKFQEFEDSPYPYPSISKTRETRDRAEVWWTVLLFPTGLDRLLGLFGVKWGREPVEQAIERKKRGLGGQKWPVAAWGMAVGE
jgi:hypothetical protein